ncbi:hypothetical protein X777_06154, partial [Ooceraea biroi]
SVPNKLNNIIKLGKDRITNNQKMEVVYRIDCNDCDSYYNGQTKRKLETRIKEHVTDVNKHANFHSVVSKHRLNHDHDFNWQNVKILHRESNLMKREVAEMVFLKRHDRTINSQNDTENLPII